MMKTCVVLNGKIINIGEWDYQTRPVLISPAIVDEDGKVTTEAVYEDQTFNPLPTGATTIEKDVAYDVDRGWYEVGTEEVDPDAELATAINNATTLDGLKAALLGNGKLARVKGKMK